MGLNHVSRYTKVLVNDRDITVVIHSIRADLTPALGKNSFVYSIKLAINQYQHG